MLKPIGQSYTSQTIDLNREVVTDVTLEAASEQEITDTVAVMGGEDLEMWVDALLAEDLLAQDATVVTYSYIGPELTWAIYRDGTIGKAKEDLEARVNKLDKTLADKLGGERLPLRQQSHRFTSINGDPSRPPLHEHPQPDYGRKRDQRGSNSADGTPFHRTSRSRPLPNARG